MQQEDDQGNELQEWIIRCDNLEDQNKQLFAQNHRLQEQIENHKQEKIEIDKDYQELQEQAERLKGDLMAQFELSQNLRQENEYFENQNQEYRKDLDNSSNYINQMSEEFEAIRAQLSAKQHQMEYLNQELTIVKEQNSNLEEDNDNLSNEIQNLQEYFNMNEQQYQEAFDSTHLQQISDYKHQSKKHSRKKTKELEQLIIKREQDISELYTALEEMKQYLHQSKNKSDKTENALNQLYKDYQSIESERNKLLTKLEQSHQYKDQYNSLQQQLQYNEKSKNKEQSSIKQQYEQMQHQNIQLKQQQAELSEELERITQQYIDLQDLNDQYLQESQIIQQSLIEKDNKIDKMSQQLLLLSTKDNSFVQQSKDSQLLVKELQQKEKDLLQQIKELTTKEKEATQQFREYQQREKELQNQVKELQFQIRDQNKEHQSQQKENQTLSRETQIKLNQQQNTISDLTMNLEQVKREKQSIIDRMRIQDEQLAEANQKYKHLELLMKQAEDERQYRVQAEQSFEEVSQQCMQLQDQNRDILRNMTNIESELDKAQEEIRLLRKSQKNSQSFDKTQQNLILKDREILHLQQVVERLEGMNRQLQQECDRLATKIQLTSHENSILSKTNREINQMGRIMLEGQQIKDFLEKKKFEKPQILTNVKSPQMVSQLQSRRPSVKK